MKVDGEKVRMMIVDHCTSIRGLAKKAHISESTVHQAINNKRNSQYRTIGKIARALNVNPAEILRH